MLKYIQIAIGVILTSFYFFPLEFTFLPGINTKMAMAGVGLVVLGFQLGKARDSIFSKDAVTISLYALAVSFTSFIAVTLNETRDYTYVSYIISMWVWLSAAYVAVMYMRKVHGYISVELVCNYLIAVCVFQCVSALLIDWMPTLKLWMSSYIAALGPTPIMKLLGAEEGRLFGFGAALDPAGSRFAAVLTLVAYVASRVRGVNKNIPVVAYLVSFFIIAIIGNMIARTTTVGIAMAGLYFIYIMVSHRLVIPKTISRIILWFVVISVVVIPIMVWLYYNNEAFRGDIRFAFEGFFSMAETGQWDVSSNERLKSMIILPENAMTWIYGDGYFSATVSDPYYVGTTYLGFYKDTDIGYLRFIFYSGIPGLLSMMAFIWQTGRACMHKFPHHKALFWLILAVNFIVWLKVSTDLFLLLALFFVIKQSGDCENELNVDAEE